MFFVQIGVYEIITHDFFFGVLCYFALPYLYFARVLPRLNFGSRKGVIQETIRHVIWHV